MKLSSDTKAVLRELRRHDRALEASLEKISAAVVEISFALIDQSENAKTELVLRRRSD